MQAISQMLPAEVTVSPPATPINPATQPKAVSQLNQFLVNALPLMSQIESIVLTDMNVAPVSGPIAGIWSQNDQQRGVWNAPANLGLTAVIAPAVVLTDNQQGPLNVPLNGVAIDVVRYFVDRGPVVWGARTLDGNSDDYCQRRREREPPRRSKREPLGGWDGGNAKGGRSAPLRIFGRRFPVVVRE